MKHHLLSATLLALALVLVRDARADQSTLTYIPSDCQAAVHLDFDRINADPQLSGMVQMFWPQVEAKGLPSFTTLSAVSAGFRFNGTEAKPDIFVALKSKSPLSSLPQLAQKAGLAPETIDGRAMHVGPDFALLPSNDQMMALVAPNPDMIGRMMDPSLGNITTRPGFTLNPTTGAQTVAYAYGGGLEGSVKQKVEEFFGAQVRQATPQALGTVGLTPEQAGPLSAALQDLPTAVSAVGAELAFLFDDRNMTTAIRLTMANQDLAMKTKRAVEAAIEVNRLAAVALGQQKAAPQVSMNGNTIDIIAVEEKQIALQMVGAQVSVMMMASAMSGGSGGGGGH